jgi:hypothetical protein
MDHRREWEGYIRELGNYMQFTIAEIDPVVGNTGRRPFLSTDHAKVYEAIFWPGVHNGKKEEGRPR